MSMVAKGVNPLGGEGFRGNEVSPFDEFLFLPTARVLFKFGKMAAMNQKKSQWPAPIPPLAFDYVDGDHDLEGTPEYVKMQEDDTMLCQLLLDLQLPDYLTKYKDEILGPLHARLFYNPQEDIFIRCLPPVWLDGHVNMASVLAARIMVDIHNRCRTQFSSYYRQLLSTRQFIFKSLDFRKNNGGINTGDLTFLDAAFDTLQSSWELLNPVETPTLAVMRRSLMDSNPAPPVYTWANTIPEMRKAMGWNGQQPSPEIERRIQQTTLKFIEPNQSDEFGFVSNPLYSGTVSLRMILQYQTLGLARANMHPSIFYMAHLYNGLRQFNLLEQEWPIMERIIHLHAKALFADAIPTNPDDMIARFCYRMNQAIILKTSKDDKWHMKPPITTSIVEHILSDDPMERARGLWQMENMFGGAAHATAAMNNKAPQRRYCSGPSYVRDLQNTFKTVLDDISIDYIHLFRACNRFLHLILKLYNAEQLQRDMSTFPVPPSTAPEEARDYAFFLMINQIFEDAFLTRKLKPYSYEAGEGETRASRSRIPNVKDPLRYGQWFNVISKVMKKFLGSKSEAFRVPVHSLPQETGEESSLLTGQIKEMLENIDEHKVHLLDKTKDIDALLASTTYVVVHFYDDVKKIRTGRISDSALAVHEFAANFSEPGILAFGRFNRMYLREARRYCENSNEEVVIFFKDGKRVAVNGHREIRASSSKALKAAVEKLGGLAKKRAAAKLENVN